MLGVIIAVGLMLGPSVTAPAAGGPNNSVCFESFSAVASRRRDERWKRTPKRNIPILIRGGDEASFLPKPSSLPINEIPVYDTIVVGGGLAGLTSGVYLTDHKRSVLLLEKEPQLGGLAAGGERGKVRYARGAAYFSPPDGEQISIFKHIGLADFEKRFEIKAPIDSYLWNGKLYPDVWEPEALGELPKSFALFRHALEAVEKKIPTQPIEDSGLLQWDHLTAAQWIRMMPKFVARMKDGESRALYQQYLADGRLDKSDPMKEVVQFLDLFSRSALGRETSYVSATAFANFYISEISERFTGPMGSGDIAQRLLDILATRTDRIALRPRSVVTNLRQIRDGVLVNYVRDGITFTAHARRVVYAGPLGLAPKLIEGLSLQAPEHARLLSELQYAHYSVHNVFVEGHPWRESYDLWIRDSGYSEASPTDVILGRWQDAKIHGYSGMRDFSQNPGDDVGLLTIYHPLPGHSVGRGYTDAEAISAAEAALTSVEGMLGPLLRDRWGTQIKVKSIETNRWPYSIHIVRPGWLTDAKILTKPIGNIYLGNNNMGLPSVEEAMYRGKRAALDVLKSLGVTVETEASSPAQAKEE